jgi:ABC-type transport system involved in multi-copper enzyme maturation permease subunit
MIALALFVWGTTSVTCVIGAYSVWRHGITPGGGSNTAEVAGVCAYVILILFGLLMLSAVAPTSLSEERQRGSLDVLVATPLSMTAILLGKWWGTFRLVPFLAIGPGLMALAMATARLRIPTTGVIFAGGRNVSLGVRLSAAVLLVATILTHGAALTSLGLALATWIKRQSRAIATSVCVFVLLAIAWPILTLTGRGALALATLSPIISAIVLGEELSSRSDRLGSALWSVGLWNVAAAATAVGFCWLTARTFDDSFGRVPERPRTSHWMTDVVVVVAGVTAAASLVKALAIWLQGVEPRKLFGHEDDIILFVYILIELLGLILLSVLAALRGPDEGWRRNDSANYGAGVPPAHTRNAGGTLAPQSCPSSEGAWPRLGPGDSKARLSATMLLDRWWRVFRLALLLAAAPGLIVLALATGREFRTVVTVEDTTFGPGTKAVMITTTSPSGETNSRLYQGDRSDSTVQAALRELSVQNPAPPLGDRLRDAGLLMLTVLAHAAAATSSGLALPIWIKRRRWRISAGVCLPLLIAIAWPIGVFFVNPVRDTAQRLYPLSVIWVSDHLMGPLINREPHPADLLGWIAAWDVAVLVFAIGLLFLVFRTVEHHRAVRAGRIAADRGASLEPSLVEA